MRFSVAVPFHEALTNAVSSCIQPVLDSAKRLLVVDALAQRRHGAGCRGGVVCGGDAVAVRGG